MTFEQYWQVVCESNPSLLESNGLKIGVEAFKRCLYRAFLAGRGTQSKQSVPMTPKQSAEFDGIMKSFDKLMSDLDKKVLKK